LQPRFGLGCHRQGTDPAPLSEVFVRFGYCARLAEQAGFMTRFTIGSKFAEACATTPERVDLPAIRNAIAVVRHLLQLFRLELQDPNARRKLRRLSQRLLTLSHVLDHIAQE